MQRYVNPIPTTAHCPCPCTRSTQATHVISMGGHYSVAASSATGTVWNVLSRDHATPNFWTCLTGIAATGWICEEDCAACRVGSTPGDSKACGSFGRTLWGRSVAPCV